MEYLFKLLYFSVKYLAFPSKKKKGINEEFNVTKNKRR